MTKSINIPNIDIRQDTRLTEKLENTKLILKQYYLNDIRPLCIAYSGGKDSTALVFIMLNVLKELKKELQLNKKTYIINSNTRAELPPLLEHLEMSLGSIQTYSDTHELLVEVHEVVPFDKHTLNVQLLGVGMPPPSRNFRWCTSKLKIQPIERKLKELFPDGKFISVVGSRRDESSDRKARIEKQSKVNSHLKINDRFPNADNLYPIEYWNTKDIWEYIFTQNEKIIDIDFLWNLYSDASSKEAAECSFAGAGGKNITEGNLGCGQSRFGCWQCYVVRDNDKSLDGLLKSGYDNIELYKEYREKYWNFTQKGWENTRDVYSHRTQQREFFDEKYNRTGMTKPKGILLQARKIFFLETLKLNNKLSYDIIDLNEIHLIQKRWLQEGDLELNAYKIAKEFAFNIPIELRREVYADRKTAKSFYKQYLNNKNLKQHFCILTLKRFAYQYTKNMNSVNKKFFPTKQEERVIRKEWKKGHTLFKTSINYPNIIDLIEEDLS
jgi:DNA sulfur modification protein DndC